MHGAGGNAGWCGERRMQQVHKRQGSTAAGCSTCGVSAWKARGRRVAQRAGSVSASLRNPASRRRVSARMPSGSLRCHSVSPASITTCVHTHVFAMWHVNGSALACVISNVLVLMLEHTSLEKCRRIHDCKTAALSFAPTLQICRSH